ncbi:cytochrome-ba3 oxidase subunit [Natranaeroarchaeum aerophilus]|uniref:Cytochrome-ba3 oxidase subunit n=1 Tax=Natranaeroarchaeum aerophilus TaxID=2917711 RepID=A0AAE3K410_9EURY|nr:cytochrome-ba3 oxidase subunit [Natranaeroarchaeum aerophilus]MCL9813072.1 cytochrome-ba3 oxidase subunit [Natranaeroarchaeum aerophilus]
MTTSLLTPRRGAALGLLAIIPAFAYAFGRPSLAGYVAAVNIVIIFASLYVAMRPVDGDHHGAEDSSHEST